MSTAAWRGMKSKRSAVRGSGGYDADIGGTHVEVRRSDSGWACFVQPLVVGHAPTLEEAQRSAERVAQDIAVRYGAETEHFVDRASWPKNGTPTVMDLLDSMRTPWMIAVATGAMPKSRLVDLSLAQEFMGDDWRDVPLTDRARNLLQATALNCKGMWSEDGNDLASIDSVTVLEARLEGRDLCRPPHR